MENHNVNSKINYKRTMFNSFQITNLGLYNIDPGKPAAEVSQT